MRPLGAVGAEESEGVTIAGTMATPALTRLDLGADADNWRAIGFTIDDDILVVGTTAIRFVDGERAGIVGWELDGDPVQPQAHTGPHENGAHEIDHVVLMTPDLDATTDDLARQGFELKRTRDAGKGTTQAFYRFANGPILEVVGPIAAVDHPLLWGVVFTTGDLDALPWPSKDAVQPGRRIATVKGAGLGTAVAFMSSVTPRNN
jgi:catechol 2,3-dioxygenase-like lactoylglutathione lyase family enzyme